MYALRSGIPIVPVAYQESKSVFKKKLTIRFGQPLNVPQSLHPTRQEINSVIEQLEKVLQELLPNSFQESDELQLFNHFLNNLFC